MVETSANIYLCSTSSRLNYEENIMELDILGDIKFYTGWGEISPIDGLSDLITISTRNKKRDIWAMLDNTTIMSGGIEEWGHIELIAEVTQCYSKLSDLLEALKEYDIKYAYNYKIITTRGYSQGDYAEVLIMDDTEYSDITKEEIGNYFWDHPIRGEVFVKDREICLCEMDLPEYINHPQTTSDINELILAFIAEEYKHAPALKNILESMRKSLPKEFKYYD